MKCSTRKKKLMKKILECDGKWYRLLREDEVIRDGDRFLYEERNELHTCSAGPLATPRMRNEVTRMESKWYREVDYLTAQMIEAKERAR